MKQFILTVFLCTSMLFAQLPDWKKKLQPETNNWRKTKQILKFNNGSEPQTLDPHLMTGVLEGRLSDALNEGLTTYDPRDLTPRPGVAKSWKISKDGKTYTFALRKNARWSDGIAVTAHDFYKSWKRALTPATGCKYVNLLYVIDGAEEFYKGKAANFGAVGIKVKDDFTLEVKLKNRTAYFLDLCAFPVYHPVRVDLIAINGKSWTAPGKHIGNGPFKLTVWNARSIIKMVRNPNYWDRDFVKLDEVHAYPIENQKTAYNKFLKGEIHWMPSIPLSQIDEVQKNPDYYVMPYLGTYFYRFMVKGTYKGKKNPFADKRVRQAITMATNKVDICKNILRAGQKPVTNFCPSVAGYKEVPGLAYDPDKAAALLAKAGYPKGKGFPEVDLLYNTSESHKKVAEVIVKQWERNLGIKVSPINREWKVYLDDTNKLNFQMSRAGWIGDYGDPSTFLNIFRSGDGNNRTGWSNKKYDTLLLQTNSEADSAKRNVLFQEMEKILLDEAPILPIYRYVNQGLLSESVLGWHENIRGLHNMKYIWLEE